MTGYIASLLGRTFGDVPLLTPRTPGVFEPTPEAEPELLTPPITTAPHQASTQPTTAPPPVIPRGARDLGGRVAQQPRFIEVLSERTLTTPSRDRIIESPPRIETHERAIPEPHIERDERATPEPRIETRERTILARENPITITNIVREPGEARTITHEQQVTEHDTRIVLPEPPPPRRHTSALQLTHITQRPAMSEQRIATTTRRTFTQPARNAQQHAPATRTHAEAPEPEPTIRVTIGRVDVRAIVKPENSRTTRSEPQGPRLSLDDYLRMRDGGSR